MRYLNKIVFINSASVKYAEVDLDGNVHFIGTQGVGKSTLLRAVLFFYNADIQKLGIPREKKNYNDYYFPFQNSYIIYEVQTENGKFSVLSFKSQGRVAFRFLNTGYNKDYFIDSDGKAFESWEGIRNALGRINSTRMVTGYEEYRNILYGNNKGLPNEFRKYALLESRQYQNIPRTISNVFLNAKLDAEFVKETIINSITEEEVKIDLTTYSQTHLRDFESHLNDIRKWTEGSVEQQAESVISTNSALQYLEQWKKEMAHQLGFAHQRILDEEPQLQEQLKEEEGKKERLKKKLSELETVFKKKERDLLKEIGSVDDKLKTISQKKKEYEALDIVQLLERVSKKTILELEKKGLEEEKQLLTSKFLEIQDRYEALVRNLENQAAEFQNSKEREKNNLQQEFNAFEKELNRQYEDILTDIRAQHKESLNSAMEGVKTVEDKITKARIKKSTVQHKRFYESEMNQCAEELTKFRNDIKDAETEIQRANTEIKSFQKDWEWEEKELRVVSDRQIEKKQGVNQNLLAKISEIAHNIHNSKDSFYGWLNEHLPNWEQNIGKVIDEKEVLFHKGLNPKKVDDASNSFFGIQINTEEINKKVKTVSDLQQDKSKFEEQILEIDRDIQNLSATLNDDLEKLKRKFQPKIRELKDLIKEKEYAIHTGKDKLGEWQVKHVEYQQKAKTEQQAALAEITAVISELNEEKIQAEEEVAKIERTIDRTIKTKKKEQELKIQEEADKVSQLSRVLDGQILEKKEKIARQINDVRTNQKKELETKGADTKRIEIIDLRLENLISELNFIENNRDKVAEYHKDKRELFDREGEFKTEKSLLNKQLAVETDKKEQQRTNLNDQISGHYNKIQELSEALTGIRDNLKEYEQFAKTELFEDVREYIEAYTEQHRTELESQNLIRELHRTDNNLTKRYINLQEDVNTFSGNFSESNIFNFKVKFETRNDYFEFAEMLREFVEEDKISEYKKRVQERFALIIRQIGRETNVLIEKEGEISKIISEINTDFRTRNFVGAIKSMELKTIESKHKIFTLLVEIKKFNDENLFNLGAPDLFSTGEQSNTNERAISLLIQLNKEMSASRDKQITLSDSFELQFKIVENDNDTGWVEKLTNVGSEGTDVLVKAMINIMLLNVFKEKATKKSSDDFRLHCMMDEIGKLHPNNVRGILKFANDRNIQLINSSPTSLNAMDYKYTYLLSKDAGNVTTIKRLVKKIQKTENVMIR